MAVTAVLGAYVELNSPATRKNILTLRKYAGDDELAEKLASITEQLSVLQILERYPGLNLPFAVVPCDADTDAHPPILDLIDAIGGSHQGKYRLFGRGLRRRPSGRCNELPQTFAAGDDGTAYDQEISCVVPPPSR